MHGLSPGFILDTAPYQGFLVKEKRKKKGKKVKLAICEGPELESQSVHCVFLTLTFLKCFILFYVCVTLRKCRHFFSSFIPGVSIVYMMCVNNLQIDDWAMKKFQLRN